MIKKLLDSKTYDENMLICMEEPSELTKALIKYQRARLSGKISELPKLRADVLEELIDNQIVGEMIKEMFNFTPCELLEEYRKKMQRNVERLGK